MYENNELMHFGVKGMKWGVRKKTYNDSNKNYSDKQRKRDTALYGKGGEKRINKRLNEGHSIQGARHYEVKRREKKENIRKNAKKAGKMIKKGMQLAYAAKIKYNNMRLTDAIFYNGAGSKLINNALGYIGSKMKERRYRETIYKDL